MKWGFLKDGTAVIVDEAAKTRTVKGVTQRIGPKHVAVHFDGGWQVMNKENVLSRNPYAG